MGIMLNAHGQPQLLKVRGHLKARTGKVERNASARALLTYSDCATQSSQLGSALRVSGPSATGAYSNGPGFFFFFFFFFFTCCNLICVLVCLLFVNNCKSNAKHLKTFRCACYSAVSLLPAPWQSQLVPTSVTSHVDVTTVY